MKQDMGRQKNILIVLLLALFVVTVVYYRLSDHSKQQSHNAVYQAVNDYRNSPKDTLLTKQASRDALKHAINNDGLRLRPNMASAGWNELCDIYADSIMVALVEAERSPWNNQPHPDAWAVVDQIIGQMSDAGCFLEN